MIYHTCCFFTTFVLISYYIMKKLLILALMFSLTTSCMVTHHTVGKGSQTGVKKRKKQVYLLWGLLPIGDVDSQRMAGGATDYEITTKTTFVDFLISIPAGFLTLRTQTIIVEK